MTIISIDTATKVCSAALWQDGEVIEYKINNEEGNHARLLPVYIDELQQVARDKNINIDAVAISEGPGSYTGLRIAAGTAKGLCYGLDSPLIPIPTTEVLCASLIAQHKALSDIVLCPMIDARRMEVYAAVYDRSLRPLRDVQADIVEADTYREWLDRAPVYFFGDGAAKGRDIITHPNAHFLEGIHPLAKHMYPLAARALSKDETVDVAYFEPFYLKDFVATKPKDLLHSNI